MKGSLLRFSFRWPSASRRALGFGGGLALAAAVNDPCSRERGNAGLVVPSRSRDALTVTAMRTTFRTTGSFGTSGARRRRCALRQSALKGNEGRTPNQALQRTAPRVTVAAIPGPHPSRPCVALSYARSVPLRLTPQLPRHAPPSLSLGSLGGVGASACLPGAPAARAGADAARPADGLDFALGRAAERRTRFGFAGSGATGVGGRGSSAGR